MGLVGAVLQLHDLGWARCRRAAGGTGVARGGWRRRLAGGVDRAEQAVGFVVDSCGEEQGGWVACRAVAEAERPESVDLDGAAVLVPEAAEEFAGCRTVRV